MNLIQLIRIALHVIQGVATLLFIFPFRSRARKNQHIQKWSKGLLHLFGIRLQVKHPERLPLQGGFLLASNHISWIDIATIHSFLPCQFVAKSEVARWPIFGWMAKEVGTIFIQRDNLRHGKEIAEKVAGILASNPVSIFPEGTSTAGDQVLPFRPNLFEAAVLARAPVYSLAIRYFDGKTGKPSKATAFVGEMTLVDSILLILRSKPLLVELVFLPAPSLDLDRKALAEFSHQQINSVVSAERNLKITT